MPSSLVYAEFPRYIMRSARLVSLGISNKNCTVRELRRLACPMRKDVSQIEICPTFFSMKKKGVQGYNDNQFNQ